MASLETAVVGRLPHCVPAALAGSRATCADPDVNARATRVLEIVSRWQLLWQYREESDCELSEVSDMDRAVIVSIKVIKEPA
jgi:hypothetical protein